MGASIQAQSLTEDMAIATWLNRWEKAARELKTPDPPTRLDPSELKRLNELIRCAGQPDAGMEATSRLIGHAAVVIMESFPNVAFNDGMRIPPVGAVARIGPAWLAARHSEDADDRAKPIRSRSAGRSNRRRVSTPDGERLRLMAVRGKAAATFIELAKAGGDLPPSPSITQMTTADDAAVREGWFDAAAAMNPDHGILVRDPNTGAIADGWAAGESPADVAAERMTAADRKRMGRTRYADLVEAATRQAKQDRYMTEDGRGPEERELEERNLRNAAARIGNNWAENGDTSSMKESNRLTHEAIDLTLALCRTIPVTEGDALCRGITGWAKAVRKLSSQRAERSRHGTGPKSAGNDQRAMGRYARATAAALTALERTQLHMAEDTRERWAELRETIERAASLAGDYRLPERPSMWESEEREALAKASIDDLRRLARMTETERQGDWVQEILLIPERWIATISTRSADGEPEVSLTEDIDTVGGKLDDIIAETEKKRERISRTTEDIMNGTYEADDDEEWVGGLPLYARAIIDNIEGREDLPDDVPGHVKAILNSLCSAGVQNALTPAKRKTAKKGCTDLYRSVATGRWAQAASQCEALIGAMTTKGVSKQVLERERMTRPLREAVRALRQNLQGLEARERAEAARDPRRRIALPNDRGEQMSMLA